jgi:hypothetical protein
LILGLILGNCLIVCLNFSFKICVHEYVYSLALFLWLCSMRKYFFKEVHNLIYKNCYFITNKIITNRHIKSIPFKYRSWILTSPKHSLKPKSITKQLMESLSTTAMPKRKADLLAYSKITEFLSSIPQTAPSTTLIKSRVSHSKRFLNQKIKLPT